ncbi:hypothetical protein LCGC14_1397660 [marine sediment metagenome]|uniref:Uncharacterized protein n=1 Tax=marine sediment metagenome TaxID=412755 RepID=A0A0F9MZL7_9ZZZZ
MSVYNPKERWLDIEIENINLLLEKLDPIESKEIEPWVFTPQTLEKVVGPINLKFIRKSLQNIAKMISYNVLMILFKYLFFKWTEEEYTKKTSNIVNKLINLYGDWWEKPILKKWFEKKAILIEELGKDYAGQIIGSIFLYNYFNKPFLYSSSGELPKDSEYIKYYEIVSNLRKEIPGYDELELWKENKLNKFLKINGYYIIGWFILTFSVFFFLEEISKVMDFILLSILFSYYSFVYVIIFLNTYYILRGIPNFWIKVFILTIDLISFFYLINIFFKFNYFYIIIIICWFIAIITFIFSKVNTKLLDKNFSFRSFISFYTISFWYLIWAVIFLITPIAGDPILDMFVFIVTLLGFFIFNQHNEDSVFSPRVWMRLKLIKPLKIYEDMGILNKFVLTVASLNNQKVEEITEQLDISKSIEFNLKKFNIKFKNNIDTIFQLITKYKEEIFYEVIPNCPKDKPCSILEKKREQFDTVISKNIIMRKIDLNSIGLVTKEKLPDKILTCLERAERYFKMFRIYNEDSYGTSVLELTKSLENLFKLLMRDFISSINALNFVGDSRLNRKLPIEILITKGVNSLTLGFFLKFIQETCSYPNNWKIKQELSHFLKKNFPIKPSLVEKLIEVKLIRNIYAHKPAEYISQEQYFKIRELCVQTLNLLRVNLSN